LEICILYSNFELYTKKSENMFEFQQYIAFLVGMGILTMGFWLMFFLVGFVFYWAIGGARDLMQEKAAKKKA